MLRRSTVVVVLMAFVLVGFYFYFNKVKEKQAIANTTLTPEAQVTYLFKAEDGLPTSIHIESKSGETVEVTRDAAGAWALIKPEKARADGGLVEAASSQLTAMRVISDVPDINPDDIGLKDPEYKIAVTFTSNVQRKAGIGVVTPTNSGYYVLTEDGRIIIVSKDSVDALLNLLTFPPYLETPTPSAIPVTDTPPPTTLEVVTPESATATPTP